jgi:hypothetical protein
MVSFFRAVFAWRDMAMSVPPTGEIVVMSAANEVDKTTTQKLLVIFEPATLYDRE